MWVVVRGYRGYNRLNTLRIRLSVISRWFKEHKGKDLEDLTFEDSHSLFKMLYDGRIKKRNGEPYKDVTTYAKNFRAFWHWLLRSN